MRGRRREEPKGKKNQGDKERENKGTKKRGIKEKEKGGTKKWDKRKSDMKKNVEGCLV